MKDPRYWPEIWPGMIEIRDVKQHPKSGYDFEWAYQMAGMKFEDASHRQLNSAANERVCTVSTKSIKTNFTWDFEAKEDNARTQSPPNLS